MGLVFGFTVTQGVYREFGIGELVPGIGSHYHCRYTYFTVGLYYDSLVYHYRNYKTTVLDFLISCQVTKTHLYFYFGSFLYMAMSHIVSDLPHGMVRDYPIIM